MSKMNEFEKIGNVKVTKVWLQILVDKGKYLLVLYNKNGVIWQTKMYDNIDVLLKIGNNLLKIKVLANNKEINLVKE